MKNLSKSLNLIYPIYEVAKEAENLLLNKDYIKFLKLMKVSWDLKKLSHPQIMKNNQLIKIDNILEKDKNLISHKLLGAGLGGFFLLVSNKKNFLNYYKPCIKLDTNE